jgi:hypothetical protein
MISSSRTLLLASALLAAASAFAAEPPRPSRIVNKEIALEVLASSMTLPTSMGVSSAVFPECGGCPPKSFPTSSNTKYFVNRQQVAVADLKAAIVGQPNLMLTAVYSVKSGELISVTADIPGARVGAPAVAPRR